MLQHLIQLAVRRWLEIWNLVFMQYERVPRKLSGAGTGAGTNAAAKHAGSMLDDPNFELLKLARPCVDTGMGLERMAAVMQVTTGTCSSRVPDSKVIDLSLLPSDG